MLRAIALSLILLLSLGALIPLATDYSEAGPKQTQRKKKKKKLKKYSRAWWKWYRAKVRKQKALAARKRALRIKRILAAQARRAAMQNKATENPVENASSNNAEVVSQDKAKANKTTERVTKSKVKVAAGENSEEVVLPTGEVAPRGWKRDKTPNSYQISDEGGRSIGSVSISDVGVAMGNDNGGTRSKTLGGVPTSALRRTVIDKMVREEGWVVNDYQKEVNGKRVYVVVAQSPGAGGKVQSRIFYFTEVNGRIVSLSTNASSETAERLAQDSEKVITSFHRKIQQAELQK